jgi:hypothetical protein
MTYYQEEYWIKSKVPPTQCYFKNIILFKLIIFIMSVEIIVTKINTWILREG